MAHFYGKCQVTFTQKETFFNEQLSFIELTNNSQKHDCESQFAIKLNCVSIKIYRI